MATKGGRKLISLEEEQKAEKLFQHKDCFMVKLISLKKSIQFKEALKEKKFTLTIFSIFAAKNFIKTENKNI